MAVVTLGIADSLIGAYFVLFLSDEAGLTPAEIGLLFSVPAIPGILISLLLGREFDRNPGRRWCLTACAASAVGYVLMTLTESFLALMLVSVAFLAVYQAVYPQIFAIAATALSSEQAADRSVSALRSAWSVSWAVGPLIGGALLATIGYTGVFFLVAALLLATMFAVGLSPLPSHEAPPGGNTTGHQREEGPARAPLGTSVLLVGGVAAFFTAMFAGGIAVPLFVTADLGLSAAFVGWLFSACAVVEMLVALLLVGGMHKVGTYHLVVLAGVAMVVHFVLLASSDGPGMLLVAQVPRGIAVAVMAAAGLRYFQERFSPRVGFATTLFSAAVDAGLVLSGLFGGLATGLVGARRALAVCGALSVLGLLMTVAVHVLTERALRGAR